MLRNQRAFTFCMLLVLATVVGCDNTLQERCDNIPQERTASTGAITVDATCDAEKEPHTMLDLRELRSRAKVLAADRKKSVESAAEQIRAARAEKARQIEEAKREAAKKFRSQFTDEQWAIRTILMENEERALLREFAQGVIFILGFEEEVEHCYIEEIDFDAQSKGALFKIEMEFYPSIISLDPREEELLREEKTCLGLSISMVIKGKDDIHCSKIAVSNDNSWRHKPTIATSEEQRIECAKLFSKVIEFALTASSP